MFQMCLAFGCLPAALGELDEPMFQLFRRFMRVEREAGRLRTLRDGFYGGGRE